MILPPSAFVFVAGLTMALSGFLLFQVQPMMARYILPWFGGSATTWTVCMLFFQVSLLLGYSYAHVFTKPLKPKAQVVIHLVFIGLSLFSLPITPSDGLKPPDAGYPTLRILALLAVCVGLPYLVLSTTTPLVQKWLASAGSGTPSRLFALSNFGSFLGLISYPLVVDLYLPTDEQTQWWSIGYVVYAVLMAVFGLLVLLMARSAAPPVAAAPTASDAAARSAPGGFWLWFTFSALASVSLLAVTNYITSYVSVNPFLWILPLSIFLLSFVVTFARPGFYNPKIFGVLYALSLIVNFFIATDYGIDNAFGVIVINIACFTLCCMLCQGELARRQPAPDGLTFFYLTIAAGGAAGGAFVSLIAPVIFPDYWELPLGLIGVGVVYLILYKPQGRVAGLLRGAPAVMLAAVVVSGALAAYSEFWEGDDMIDRKRNFYGVLKVDEIDANDPVLATYAMRQAGENQGEQLVDPARHNLTACYFGVGTGIHLAIGYLQRQNPEGIRAGIIGLGAGMALTYGRPQDFFHYYELNPVVTDFARKHFTFMSDAKSKVEVTHGDGRLALERELKSPGPRQYDILHVDAFRGNAPPAHLMTRESFEIYYKHLREGGIIAVTSHNDYYDASSLLRGMADLFGAKVGWIPTAKTAECDSSLGFALISRDGAVFESEPIRSRISPWPDGGNGKIVWTDQSSSLMSLMVWSR